MVPSKTESEEKRKWNFDCSWKYYHAVVQSFQHSYHYDIKQWKWLESLISLNRPRLRTTGSANKKSWQDGSRNYVKELTFPLTLFHFLPLWCPPPFSPSLLFPLSGNCKPKAFGADWGEVDQALLPCPGQWWAEMCNIVMLLKL